MRALRMVTVTAVIGVSLGTAAGAWASVYAGKTAQHDPIVITVSNDGKRVQKIAVDWEAECQSKNEYRFGGILTARAKPPGVTVPGDNPLLRSAVRKGKLDATSIGSASLGEDLTAAIRQTVRGKFNKSFAFGTWRARVNVLDAGGTTKDTCDSGTVRWAATHAPAYYGGLTSQGEPVVVETTTDGAEVDYFGIGWGASCSDGNSFHVGDELGDFPLTRSGVFGASFGSDFPFPDGTGKVSVAWTVKGKVRKRRASGTFSVHRAESDVAGATTSTCDTQTVEWSATH
ncbi:MAG: hypothetical protein ACJ77Z_18200 [Thermoleophilaceae bacterium]|jgi:hypothetical protein